MYSNQVYRLLSKYLVIFEKKGKKIDELKYHEGNEFDVILFGYNRMGKAIQKSLKKMKVKYLIVDYNPEVIKDLFSKGIESRYGDVGDLELLDELNLCKSQMVISTVKDYDTNALMIKNVRSKNKKTIIITVSNQEEEALELYKKGSTYVVLPHHLGGHHAAMMIEDFGFNIGKFIKEKDKHSKQLSVTS
jgi:Trk K+ transport system NAD-binding subunit